MKTKVKLNSLNVTSFTTDLDAKEKQTVNGGYRANGMSNMESICWCVPTQAATCTNYPGPTATV